MMSDTPLEKLKYPVVALRDSIVFPLTENALLFGRQQSVHAIRVALSRDNTIVLAMQKKASSDEPGKDDLYSVGILATIEKVMEGSKGEVSALIRGKGRVLISNYTQEKPFFEAEVIELSETFEETEDVKALVKHIDADLKKAVNLGKSIDVVFLMNIMSESTPREFSEQVAMILDIETKDRQELVEEIDLYRRLVKEADLLAKEIKVLEIERNIHRKTQKKFEKGMKDAVLREKLKTIEQELGSGQEQEVDELRAKIQKSKMPKESKEKALKELARLESMNSMNPESSYIRTYLEMLTDLPWGKKGKEHFDLKKAQATLDKDHYGLEKAKERILEFLAVMKLRSESESKLKKSQSATPTILCFAGPPGVGKTSLGKSIARSLGRKFVKMSLGGVRDEAEIRGHRRTYVGALPGRIIQGIRQAGTINPVFMLDEIDKLSSDYRGDPSAALLEALDPEQNYAFEDHYLEIPFDLSQVMFITTANMLDSIPYALRDRLEIINFAGYTEDEKFHIARNYLVKKQLRAHGLEDKHVSMTSEAIRLIITKYTREAGVRELERQIASNMRKVAREIVESKKSKMSIGIQEVRKNLGAHKYSSQMAEKEDMVGTSTGLAVTNVGGDILSVEVGIMPGKGTFILTGKLGDVMKESFQAALSYVRSRHKALQLPENFYEKIDIHVHVPEGAVPKDGPSAGLAIATALVSALTKIPVKRTVAMTGEITLRGRALEIGGVKSKVLAAHRAGIKTVILPAMNKKDMEDVPAFVKKDIEFVFVKHIDEVLKTALSFSGKAKAIVTAS